jgi:hypothetical protein
MANPDAENLDSHAAERNRMRARFRALSLASFATIFIASTFAIAHGEGEDDGGWRDLFGGFDVMVSASFLHSIGAILLVGGLLHIHSRLRTATKVSEEPEDDGGDALDALVGEPADSTDESTPEDGEPNIGGQLSNRLIYVGVAMNLIGGISRLFEPGHPSLLETIGNRWVTIMLVKHLFVLIMCGTAIYATLPRGTTSARLLSTRMALAAVVVIGAMGSLASVVGPA